MKNKKKIKIFILITLASIILIGFFVIIIMKEKSYILKNGEDFEAKCVDVYKKGVRGSNHKQQTVYVFEVTYPSEIKGEKFEKANPKYTVGRTYKGKYIDNEKHNQIHNRYEFQITE